MAILDAEYEKVESTKAEVGVLKGPKKLVNDEQEKTFLARRGAGNKQLAFTKPSTPTLSNHAAKAGGEDRRADADHACGVSCRSLGFIGFRV